MKPRASATNSRNSAPSSGYGNIATAVNAAKLGAVDYLAKPVDADDVAAALLAIDNKKVGRRKIRCGGPVRGEHIQRI